MEGEPSRTAIATAVARGRHRLHDDPPWVLDDPFALSLAGPIWRLVERRALKYYPPPVDRAYRAGIVLRSRYTEDRLVERRFAQYVLLGAGLDAFVWRRPDVVRTLRIFEVDHPESQRAKRERAAELALPEPPEVVYVPVDFEVDALADRLDDAGIDWSSPTLFSWLGVTMYLSLPAIDLALRTVTRCTPGSEIVFTYAPARTTLDDVGRQFDEVAGRFAAEAGEPMVTYLSRPEVERVVERAGLEVAAHPHREELVSRYFSTRGDALEPFTAESLLAARVPLP